MPLRPTHCRPPYGPAACCSPIVGRSPCRPQPPAISPQARRSSPPRNSRRTAAKWRGNNRPTDRRRGRIPQRSARPIACSPSAPRPCSPIVQRSIAEAPRLAAADGDLRSPYQAPRLRAQPLELSSSAPRAQPLPGRAIALELSPRPSSSAADGDHPRPSSSRALELSPSAPRAHPASMAIDAAGLFALCFPANHRPIACIRSARRDRPRGFIQAQSRPASPACFLCTRL